MVGADGVELPAESVIDGNLLLNEDRRTVGPGDQAPARRRFRQCQCLYRRRRQQHGGRSVADGVAERRPTRRMSAWSLAIRAAAQTVTWRAVFGTSVGNFAWQEFTVANGNSDTAKNLNRVEQIRARRRAADVDGSMTVDHARREGPLERRRCAEHGGDHRRTKTGTANADGDQLSIDGGWLAEIRDDTAINSRRPARSRLR